MCVCVCVCVCVSSLSKSACVCTQANFRAVCVFVCVCVCVCGVVCEFDMNLQLIDVLGVVSMLTSSIVVCVGPQGSLKCLK